MGCANDHAETRIGDIGNYYGGLMLCREDGVDYWAIENWDGCSWHECPPKVAAALRSTLSRKELQRLQGEATKEAA